MNKTMRVIAIIPARGGSKRIPKKNILPLFGRPLIAHSISHALQSSSIAEVYVSTDDKEIAEASEAHGAEVILRPVELSGDSATSEQSMLHVLDELKAQGKDDPDLIVFLQCTSPVRKADDIDNAIQKLLSEGADSLFSATKDLGLFWNAANELTPVNYNPQDRKMEQDRSHQFRENGSIFVLKPSVLRENNNRFGGKIAMYEMDFLHSFQIDEQEDIALVDWVLRTQVPNAPSKKVEAIIFDFDGVMTDNTLSVTEEGIESVQCDRGDGLGIANVRKAGIPMMVLSTEKNPVVATRCEKLQLPCHQGVDDKLAYLQEYLQNEGIDPAHVIFVGNDVNDLACMQFVGVPIAPADADPAILRIAHWITKNPGGHGAVREVCDWVLSL